jgi:hypothetical protein
LCGTCLLVMFFESAFGICLGCKLYTLFNREPVQLCPGDMCEVPAQGVPGLEWKKRLILVTQDPAEAERGKAPDFAKATGHGAQWMLHNHCQ